MTIRRVIAILLGIVVIAAALTIGYGLMLRRSAERLVRSAMEVRSSTDVARIAEMWRRKYGREFIENGTQDGNRTYNVVITNEFLHKLRLVPFTYLLTSIITKDHQPQTVIVSMYVEPQNSIRKAIWVQEDFSEPSTLFRVQTFPDNQMETVRAKVSLSGGVPDPQRSDAFNVNTSCLIRFSGCETPQQMLPAVKEISSPSS
jgi:hypothetical protein